MLANLALSTGPVLALLGSDLAAQVFITLGVVAVYHLWMSGRGDQKKAAPPAVAKPVAVATTALAAAVAPAPAAAPPQPVPVPKPVAASEELQPELLAVIAAAIATVLDRPYKMVALQPLLSPVSQSNAWALEGRTQIFHSHVIR